MILTFKEKAFALHVVTDIPCVCLDHSAKTSLIISEHIFIIGTINCKMSLEIDCFYGLQTCIQGVPKNLQSIENNLLLEFQWPSTNLKVKSAKY